MPAVAIREAGPGDIDEVAAMIRELAEFERLADQVRFDVGELRSVLFGPDPPARVLLAESAAGEVAGYALWYRTFSTFLGRPGIWLEDLYVRPAHRRQGHARSLLAHLRASTAGRVEWAVLDWNAPAIALYEDVGARPEAGWARYRWVHGP